MNCTYNYPYQMVDQVAHKSTEISIFRPCYNLSPTKFSCSGCLHCSKKYPFIPYTVSHIMKSCLLGQKNVTWISLGNVALNISVWRSPALGIVSWSTMRRICGSNPMSNMRSASSKTRNLTKLTFVHF